MDLWKQAYDFSDIVLENGRIMWLVYITFFIVALMVHRKDNNTRRKTGIIMIVASIPGLLISAANAALFLHAFISCFLVMRGGEYLVPGDSDKLSSLENLCNTIPITLVEFSLPIFFTLAIISIIVGITIIKKKAGKVVGPFAILYGAALGVFTVWFLFAYIAFLGD